ncbi:MAG TPA: PspC domain-containing protein [Streptosporangiaceae bacterium]|jgi:phage shock protein PspC (stress-responsive transcriptional regulator)|nr:PspC domain-containing protein [Streptosporangiaceae bacterium]
MEQNASTGTNANTKPRELRRTRTGRMIAGVCSGAGEHFGVDANILRLVLAGLCVFTAGTAAFIYVAGWLLIPEEGERTSIVQGLLDKQWHNKRTG